MYFYFTFFLFLFSTCFLTSLVSSQTCGGVQTSGIKCTNDNDCLTNAKLGKGWVCSNSPSCCPEFKTCIYACHYESDRSAGEYIGCNGITACSIIPETDVPGLPHYLCVCLPGYDDCYEGSSCMSIPQGDFCFKNNVKIAPLTTCKSP
jgi:hypothetical protein